MVPILRKRKGCTWRANDVKSIIRTIIAHVMEDQIDSSFVAI